MLRKNVKLLLEQLQVCIFAKIVFGVRCTLMCLDGEEIGIILLINYFHDSFHGQWIFDITWSFPNTKAKLTTY